MREVQWLDDTGKEPATIRVVSKPNLPKQTGELEENRIPVVILDKKPSKEGESADLHSDFAKDSVQENLDVCKDENIDLGEQQNAEQAKTDHNEDEEKTEDKELSSKDITDQIASLWKYLPVPESEPDPAPEYKVTNAIYPGAKIIAARVRGKKHKHEGSNCDDWFETSCCDDVTFAAVSDGAGSKKFSRIGAKVSCKAAIGYLVNEYPKLIKEIPNLRKNITLPLSDEKCISACGMIAELVQQAVLQAREAVRAAFYSRSTDSDYQKVLQRNLLLEDLGGTLLVTAIVPVRKETKEHLVVTCQVGDGMTASINKDEAFQASVKLLAVPDSGDFTGETEFLTSKKMEKIAELQKRTKLSLGPVDTVLMMTDGVADDYFPNETQIRRLYYDLIANGILHVGRGKISLSDLSPEQISLFKKIPDPIAYPWVNDKSVFIPIQYTNRICKIMNLSLEDLWNQREILSLAALEVRGKAEALSEAEILNQWLDNYYERGSFDDRTLVVIDL